MGDSSGIQVTAQSEHEYMRVVKWRVRAGFPVTPSQAILLYKIVNEEGEEVDKSLQKLKVHRVGVVKKCLVKEGALIKKGDQVLLLSECAHTTVMKDMCADCGADLRQNENGKVSEASVPMIHSIPELKVTQKEAQELGRNDTLALLEHRKLVLLVDLDQTLIHTTNDNVPNNIKGIYHFQLYGAQSPWYHTRLRPGTREFLQRMSKIFELHICTFGARNYAHMIAQLLDPDEKLFSHRILSRDECFNATSKTDNLKALFPNGDSMVCIIDDREDVWNMASNLIQVKPYHFFQHTGDINAPPGLSKHELDGEGVDFKEMENLATDGNEEKAANLNKDDKTEEIKPPSKSDVVEEAKQGTDDAEEKEISVEDDSQKEVTIDVGDNSQDSNVSSKKPSSSAAANSDKTKSTAKDDDALPSSSSSSSNSRTKTNSIPTVPTGPKLKVNSDAQNEIEIEDLDDYLLYLEVILTNIHKRFYKLYDETGEIPDLKIVVPKLRAEVLRGLRLVFSGLVPNNFRLEQSRAYFIAKSLGADVASNIVEGTTHLVAVTSGTFKVNAARKNPKIKIVNANWLWCCAERWEHVEETLFPVDRKIKGKQRQPPAHCHSPEHVINYSEKSEIPSSSGQAQPEEKFSSTIHPMFMLSQNDLADMREECAEFLDSDSSDDDLPAAGESVLEKESRLKRKYNEDDESEPATKYSQDEDLGTDIGYKYNKEKESKDNDIDLEEEDDDDDDDADADAENDDDDMMPSEIFRLGGDLPSDIEYGSNSDDGSDDNNPDEEDDGEWNMMGAALEREFLGLRKDED